MTEDKRNIQNNELLIKLDEFIRKYYKNRLLRGAIFFIGVVGLVAGSTTGACKGYRKKQQP